MLGRKQPEKWSYSLCSASLTSPRPRFRAPTLEQPAQSVGRVALLLSGLPTQEFLCISNELGRRQDFLCDHHVMKYI